MEAVISRIALSMVAIGRQIAGYCAKDAQADMRSLTRSI